MPDLREDQWAIHVDVDGVSLPTKPWSSMEGGDIEAKGTKTRPGGMADEETLGGPQSRTDATVMIQYSNDVLHPLVPKLQQACGSRATSISYTPLDGDGNPNGETHTITGKLDTVHEPKKDSNSPSNAAFLSLIISCNVPLLVS